MLESVIESFGKSTLFNQAFALQNGAWSSRELDFTDLVAELRQCGLDTNLWTHVAGCFYMFGDMMKQPSITLETPHGCSLRQRDPFHKADEFLGVVDKVVQFMKNVDEQVAQENITIGR